MSSGTILGNHTVMTGTRLSPFARWFVLVIFLLLGLSFIASTTVVLHEFKDTELWFILGAYSNLFVYFPTLGLVALAAFYVPAVIFTDLYWRGRVNGGRIRFGLGFAVVMGLAWYTAEQLNDTHLRPLWEIAPARLYEDKGIANACPILGDDLKAKGPPRSPSAPSCRPTLLGSASDLRSEAAKRIALSPLARVCLPDGLLEPPAEYDVARYCFPAHTWLKTSECCRFQSGLAGRALELWSRPENRSQAAHWDRTLFLPMKAFFIIVITLIGVLLVFRRGRLAQHYADLLPAMEKGLQIGALAMLPWLLMDYAQQQVSDVLYGPTDGFPFRPSLVLIPWALLLAGYFADRIQIELVRLVQLASGVISAVAILNYRSVFDWSAKLVGVGASPLAFYLLAGTALAVLLYLLFWIPGALRGEEKGRDDAPEVGQRTETAADGPMS